MNAEILVITLVLTVTCAICAWARRFSEEEVAALAESAYYAAICPKWVKIYADHTEYAIPREDAQRFGVKDKSEMPLHTLAKLLVFLRNEESYACAAQS